MKTKEYLVVAGIAFVMALVAIALLARNKLPKAITSPASTPAAA